MSEPSIDPLSFISLLKMNGVSVPKGHAVVFDINEGLVAIGQTHPDDLEEEGREA